MAENGVLWLDYPSIGGPSPDIPVIMTNDQPNFIRRHSSFLPQCKKLPWVSASAIAGLQSLEITLSNVLMTDATYSICFYFVELESNKAGDRVFNVEVQGKPFLRNFDIVKESGGIKRDIVKVINGIRVKDTLVIRFTPSELAPDSQAILSGIEIISDELDAQVIWKQE